MRPEALSVKLLARAAAIGGAEEKEHDPRILKRFVRLSGGHEADIVVIPTASRLEDTGARHEKIFEDFDRGNPRQMMLDCYAAYFGVRERVKKVFQEAGIAAPAVVTEVVLHAPAAGVGAPGKVQAER